MEEFYFSKNLTRLRTFYGYKQKEISEKLQVTRQAYSHYERGTRLPDLETAVRIAKFYQIPLDCLLLAPDPVKRISESPNTYGYAGVTPAGSLILMDGPEARMHLTYKRLSEEGRREARAYIRFKEQWEESSERS